MTTDYDEELGYDADHDDPNQYCVHGVWIGSWWGPDYLCQYCEMGVTLEGMQLIEAGRWYRREKEQLKNLMLWYRWGKLIWELESGAGRDGTRTMVLGRALDELWGNWETIKAVRKRASEALARKRELEERDGGRVLRELEEAYG